MNEEAMIRIAVEGTEFAYKATKELLALMVAILKGAYGLKTRDKFLELQQTTKNLRFISLNNEDAAKLAKGMKEFKLKFLAFEDSNADGITTVAVRNEDAALINRIIERENIDRLDDTTAEEISNDPQKAGQVNEYSQVKAKTETVEEKIGLEDVTNTKDKLKTEDLAEETINPKEARVEDGPSVQDLKNYQKMKTADRDVFSDVTKSIEDEILTMAQEYEAKIGRVYSEEDPIYSTGDRLKVTGSQEKNKSIKETIADKDKMIAAKKDLIEKAKGKIADSQKRGNKVKLSRKPIR